MTKKEMVWTMNSQMPWWASYGVSFESNLERNDMIMLQVSPKIYRRKLITNKFQDTRVFEDFPNSVEIPL